ncbi:hypothetical protein EVAR_102795_1 [Eumeta japonica]|uniref:Uncharacterized protein n=1 Tax=Eumeta variegata TaxID=151549 RepID=A0A4C1TIV3_EUMVA|nr:hypothetical protein EVAR_102795_1 [Eumeta japonica]
MSIIFTLTQLTSAQSIEPLSQPLRTCVRYSLGGWLHRTAVARLVVYSPPSLRSRKTRRRLRSPSVPVVSLAPILSRWCPRSRRRRDRETSKVELIFWPVVVTLGRSSRCL